MCDTYRDDPTLSRDANAILRQMDCLENRRQLGHCVVWVHGRGNVAGIIVGPGAMTPTAPPAAPRTP